MGSNPHNPVTVTANPDPRKSRDRVLSDAEIAAVWRACGEDDFGRITKLLILTGCRREEVGGLRWNEIGAETITLPAERVKNRRQHVLPITAMMAAVLGSIRRMEGRDHLFGPRSAVGFSGWLYAKRLLDKRLADKLSANFNLHDVRRTVATRMIELGVQPHVVEAVLNHYSGHRAGVAGTYNRSPYTAEIHAALTMWGEHVKALVEGGKPKVINLSTRRQREPLSA